MANAADLGYQYFSQVITNNIFYIDKTAFAKEWWENYGKNIQHDRNLLS